MAETTSLSAFHGKSMLLRLDIRITYATSKAKLASWHLPYRRLHSNGSINQKEVANSDCFSGSKFNHTTLHIILANPNALTALLPHPHPFMKACTGSTPSLRSWLRSTPATCRSLDVFSMVWLSTVYTNRCSFPEERSSLTHNCASCREQGRSHSRWVLSGGKEYKRWANDHSFAACITATHRHRHAHVSSTMPHTPYSRRWRTVLPRLSLIFFPPPHRTEHRSPPSQWVGPAPLACLPFAWLQPQGCSVWH